MPKLDGSETVGPTYNTATTAALELASQGIRVFPCYHAAAGVCSCPKRNDCHSPGKHPLVKNGVDDATTNRSQLTKWANKWGTTCNWGQALDGRVVIDVDVAEGKTGDHTWKELCAEHSYPTKPDTLTLRTGRNGTQYIYTWDGSDLPDKLGLHIDLKRGGGHYIMVAGSVTTEPYAVTRDTEAATLPPWVATRAQAFKGPKKKTRSGVTGSIRAFTPQEANDYIDNAMDKYGASRNGSIDIDANTAFTTLWHFIGNHLSGEMAATLLRANAPADMTEDHIAKFERQALDPGYELKTDPWKATITTATPQLKPFDGDGCNDASNGRRLVRKYGDRLKYTSGTRWLVWDGKRWKQDTLEEVAQLAKKTSSAIYGEAQHAKPEYQRALSVWATKSLSAGAVAAMQKMAQSEPEIRVETKALDAVATLFNTKTGTLDLNTGAVREHRASDLITKMSNVDLDPAATSPVWDGFLEWCQPDPEVRAWLQELFGYALLGEVRDHVMPIFIGSGGNGKGTLRDALAYAFGEYAVNVGPELLMITKHQQHKAFKMRLRGMRLVFTSETEEGTKFNEAEMKALTGGDPIEANLMRENPEEFQPSHTMILLTNTEPMLNGADYALTRRIRVVPFNAKIAESDMDVELPTRLREAAPAILAWAWAGWLRYKEYGKLRQPPAAISSRTEDYFQTADVLTGFLNEMCIKGIGKTVSSVALHQAFRVYAGEDDAGSVQAFAGRMKKHNYYTRRGKSGMVWQGIALAVGPGSNYTSSQQGVF